VIRSLALRTGLLAVLVLTATIAHAVDEVYATDAGAIRGYDPVAYHTQGKPVPGSAELTHQWNGATWRFANAEHRDLFAADPERYAPRYGGYCAYGTSQGYKVSTQPEAFAIVDGAFVPELQRAGAEHMEQGPARVHRHGGRQLEQARARGLHLRPIARAPSVATRARVRWTAWVGPTWPRRAAESAPRAHSALRRRHTIRMA
jgi:YHS domain-containing protein